MTSNIDYVAALLVLCLLPNTILSGCGPGKSGCWIYGTQDTDCGQPLFTMENMPSECTSFIYDGYCFIDSSTVEICFPNTKPDVHVWRILNAITSTPLYLTISHKNGYEEWNKHLDVDGTNACKDAESLSQLLESFDNRITGVIFLKLLYGIKSSPPDDFTDRFKTYLEIVKKKMPNVEFAINLGAVFLYEFTKSLPLKFNLLSDLIDFYTINFYAFNDCSDKTQNGTAPMKHEGNLNTMELMQSDVLSKLSVGKEKIYFIYDLFADLPKSEKGSGFFCDQTYAKICQDPEKTVKWCSDNSNTLREKGLYTTQYANGFIGAYIDLDDFNEECECEMKSPAFHYILGSYNGVPIDQQKGCAKFDRIKTSEKIP